ncbi:MAG: DUF4258 domain-containing protein [Thermoproteota archaeon]
MWKMGIKEVDFTAHAEDKLKRLVALGVTKEKVLEIIRNPEKTILGHYGRRIAQGLLTDGLMLRVVYEENEKNSGHYCLSL